MDLLSIGRWIERLHVRSLIPSSSCPLKEPVLSTDGTFGLQSENSWVRQLKDGSNAIAENQQSAIWGSPLQILQRLCLRIFPLHDSVFEGRFQHSPTDCNAFKHPGKVSHASRNKRQDIELAPIWRADPSVFAIYPAENKNSMAVIPCRGSYCLR
jgi:hypothetical protein